MSQYDNDPRVTRVHPSTVYVDSKAGMVGIVLFEDGTDAFYQSDETACPVASGHDTLDEAIETLIG